jgi:predicted Zn-dependent peptidase
MRPIGTTLLLASLAVLVAAVAPPLPGAASPAAVLAAAPAAPAGPGPATDVRLLTLRNGMRVLLAPDTAGSAVDVAVWYRAGTTHERPGITGISHLFEQLMFGGSEHFGPQEHNRLIQAEGGSTGAYTAPDYACTYETLPAAALDLALKLEADRIAGLRLTPAAVEAGRKVAVEEKRWRAGTQPAGVALQGLQDLVWPTHPYRWPLTGLDEDLARISLADCQAYAQEHYAPNNALVTIVGRFDPDAALQSAKRWLEPLKRRSVGGGKVAPEPAQKSERRAARTMGVPLPTLLVGWRTPAHSDPDLAALGLLTRILAVGPASRLQRALLADPLRCVSVQGALDSRRDSGLLYALTVLRPGVDSAAVERTLIAEADRLAREPVSDEELDRARRQEEFATLNSWQSARGSADALGSAELVDGDWRAAAARLARVRTLTPADLQQAAARVFATAGRSVFWAVPDHPLAPGPVGAPGDAPQTPPAGGGR